jgi:hypothetical protein
MEFPIADFLRRMRIRLRRRLSIDKDAACHPSALEFPIYDLKDVAVVNHIPEP